MYLLPKLSFQKIEKIECKYKPQILFFEANDPFSVVSYQILSA